MSKALHRSRDDVIQAIDNIIISSFGVVNVTRSSRFADDLGADSLDEIELTLDLEAEFGVEVDDGRLGSFENVGEVHDYITTQLGLGSEDGVKSKELLSERVRPDSEVHAWVHAEIIALEADLERSELTLKAVLKDINSAAAGQSAGKSASPHVYVRGV